MSIKADGTIETEIYRDVSQRVYVPQKKLSFQPSYVTRCT